ncbi:MAG: glycosyltransferase [Candidatus Eremiobacteraeota bacterium]|nr:glycosyltransferase [Candidatus Eremiobacteraeota bacterium]
MTVCARNLLVVTSRYPFGSQEAYLGTELEELKQYFKRITVVPVRTPKAMRPHVVPEGIDVLSWPLFDPQILSRALGAAASAPMQSLDAIFALMTSHDPGKAKNAAVALKGLALGQWAREAGVDHIHAYWISTPATVAYIASAVAGIPWSATAHRWDIYEKNAFDVKARAAAFVRTISERGTRDLRARMPSLASRIREIRLGAIVPRAARSTIAMPRAALRIVCPAALVPVKGHEDLMQAVALLRGEGIAVECIFAGTGPLRAALEERAVTLCIEDAVEFAGHVPQHVLHRWYSSGNVDAVVLASRADGEMMMEGLPSALIESMAYGIPTVATDSGSISELLDDDCGYLVRPGSPEMIAAALRTVYRDPRGARARSARAYERVKRLHDVHVQMRMLASAFFSEEGVLA